MLQTIDINGNLKTSSTGGNGSALWGDIFGIITNQTDLVSYVNGQDFITASSVANLTNKTGNISQWTNDAGYITSISGAVTSVSGTANRITSSGGSTPSIDIASNYIGQNTITTLGTITTGIWNGTAIANANLANSSITINGNLVSLGASTTITAAVPNALTVSTGLQLNSGTTFDGSAARTISIDATVVTLTGAQALSNKTGNISQWTNDSGYITGNQTITLSSEASGSGTTGIAVTLLNSAVIGKVITGYVSGAGVVAATDTILQAIQKLNGNTAALVTGVSSVFGRTGAVVGAAADYSGVALTGVTSINGLIITANTGTITTGVWNGTVIGGTYGGTGVNNGSSTITLAGNLVTSGAFSITLTVTGTTSVTLPTSGTLVSSVTTANGVSASNTAGALSFTLGAITPTTVNGNTFTTGSSTYTGTAAQTYTFPTTTATIARTDAANTFTGANVFSTGALINASSNTFRTTNAGSNVASSPFIVDLDGSTTTAGAQALTFETANGFGFTHANGTRRILGAAIKLANLNNTAGSEASDLIFSTQSAGTALTQKFRMSALGNIVAGNEAALATNATDGFLYIPTCAGAPSGVPTAYTGKVAMIYDTTNNKLYIYNGAWKGGTAPGAWS